MQDPALTPRPLPAVDDVRRALADVLAEPALQRAMRPPDGGVLRWAADLVAKVRDMFEGWVRWLSELRLHNPDLFWLLFVGLMGVACLLLWHVVWTMSRIIRGSRDAGALATAPDAVRSAHSRALRTHAHALAAKGELRDGVRHLLLALLALVEERKLLAVASSWTLREIAARLAKAAPTLPVHDLTARVENACYGAGQVTQADFAEVDRWLDTLLQVEVRATPNAA